MNTRVKVLVVAIVAALVGFMLQVNSPLGQQIWPKVDGPEPAGGALGALIAMSVIEAVAFGAGVAFLVFGFGRIRSTPGVSRNLAIGAYLAIGWSLVNWVPHSAMHMTNAADDFGRLAVIEYLFHFTMMLGGVVLARFFWRAYQEGRPAAHSSMAGAATTTMVK